MDLRGFLATVVLAIVATAVAASSRLDIIDLPLGFSPEGITLAEKWTVYVGSFNTEGAIWKGDLRTGEGEIVISGGQAAGLDYDRRSGYLFVAGAFTGSVRIYDTADFSLVAEFAPAGTDVPSMVNDVIVTETAAFFTDSFQAQLYSVPLKKYSGRLRNGADTVADIIPLSSDFTLVDGNFNANGIEVTDDGKTLLVVNSATGKLFSVDPESGEASLVDLGGVSVHGDGMVLRQNTLWIVENTAAAGDHTQIVEVSLSEDLSCGSVLPRVQVNEYFDFPTTTVRKGNSFYTVMLKFAVAAEDVATTAYEIVRTDRDSGLYMCPAN